MQLVLLVSSSGMLATCVFLPFLLESPRYVEKRREERRDILHVLRGVWCVVCVLLRFCVVCVCLVQCVLLVRTTYVNTVVTPRLPLLLHLKVPSPRRASKRRAQNRGPHSPVEWAAAERRLRGDEEGDEEGGGEEDGEGDKRRARAGDVRR